MVFPIPTFKDDMWLDDHDLFSAPRMLPPMNLHEPMVPFFKPQHNHGFPMQSSADQDVKDGKDLFEVEMAVNGFEPEELQIQVKEGGKLLTVSATHEENAKDGTKMVSKQFSRSFNLPDDCNLEKMQSKLSQNGILKIVAPKIQPAIENRTEPTAAKSGMIPEHKRSIGDGSRSGQTSRKTSSSTAFESMMPELRASPFNTLPMQDQTIPDRFSECEDSFDVSVDVHGFQPEDLQVQVNQDGTLTLTARHEEKGEGRSVIKQFSRSFNFPPSCKLEEVSSALSKDGILKITAPKRKSAIEQQGRRDVPIKRPV